MNNIGGHDALGGKWLLIVVVASIIVFMRSPDADPAIQAGAAAIGAARAADAGWRAPHALQAAEDTLWRARQSALAGDERTALRLAQEAELAAQQAQAQAHLAGAAPADDDAEEAPLLLRPVGYRGAAGAALPR
jgi:hypothetical protein